MSKYGRIQVAEPLSALARLHVRDGATPLRAVSHEPKNGVLDQEDLIEQGIDTSKLIPGAAKVDALGSCTANATMSALSLILSRSDYLGCTKAKSYQDVVGIEEAAIRFYNGCTDQTGSSSREWPPTDCGSSGPYIASYAKSLGLISGDTIASGATAIVSLLQTGGVLTGSPWFNAWEEPGADGFIDGDGSPESLRKAIASGVAGGHETFWWGIERLRLDAAGNVTAANTIGIGRNSWTKSWGDEGNYRFHFSTFAALAQSCDHRQLVPAAQPS